MRTVCGCWAKVAGTTTRVAVEMVAIETAAIERAANSAGGAQNIFGMVSPSKA
jgi:hypothetical protein